MANTTTIQENDVPNVSIALTHAVKRQWADHWELRPTDDPPDLLAVLEDSEQVTDFTGYGFVPKSNVAVWAHDDLPDHCFIVRDRGVEWVVVCLVRRQKRKEKLVVKIPPPPPPIPPVPERLPTDEPPPVIGDEPDGTPEEKSQWVFATKEKMSAWFVRNRKAHPDRKGMSAVYQKLIIRARELKAEVAAGGNGSLEDGPECDRLAFTTKGKVDFTPAVRWLLREVKELRGRVAELESAGTPILK